MAEEEEEQEEEAQRAPVAAVPQPSLLRYLPILVVVLLLQAGGAYYLIDRYLYPEVTVSEIQDEEGRARTIPPEGSEPQASVTLGEFVANPRGTQALLLVRAKVVVGVAPSDVKAEIENVENQDRIKDAVIWSLGNATYDMLRTPEGRDEAKREIKERINEFLYDGQILDVYFEEFLLQALPGYRRG
ncbi:MAG: flagellar basal body-associated FliL family protein [Candidatus Latescibacteria bacterium]|nr:flagellar basal body-associated FliL family protein [Candidatus Latescibacterota bacterium]